MFNSYTFIMIMKKYLFVVFAMTMLFAMDVKAIENTPTIHNGDTREYVTYIRPNGFTRAAMSEEYVAWGIELTDPIPPVVAIASTGGDVSLNATGPGNPYSGNFSFDITGDPCFGVFVFNEDHGSTECRIRIYYFPSSPGVHYAKLTMNCSGRTPQEVTLKGIARLAGDLNMDDMIDVSDVVGVIETILGKGDADPDCADVDGSENVDVNDVTTLITTLLNAR